MISPNIIIGYDASSGSVPGSFSVDTTFQNRLPVHSNTGTGSTGGATTHTHASSAHSHSLNAHKHTISFGYYEEMGAGPGENHVDPKRRHNHASVTSDNNTSASSSSNSFTTGSGSTLPPYYAINFIKSDGYNLIPPNGIVYAQSAKTGLTLCNGSSGTPDLRNKFLIGAGGSYTYGSTGGSSTHIHTINHSHSSGASHTHTGTSGVYQGPWSEHGGPDGSTGVNPHTHPFTTGSTTASISSYSGNSGNNTNSSLPPNTSLLPLKNMGASGLVPPIGSIAMTKSTTIPLGWLLCDGSNGTLNLATNKYIMCNSSVSTSGGTTHTHATVSHTHSSSGHTHSGTTNSVSSSTYQAGTSGSWRGRSPHSHSLSGASTTATYANGNYAIGDTNNNPTYIEVKYIQLDFLPIAGASVITNFL